MINSHNQVSFLDTLISVTPNAINTQVYHKPTDRNTFLHETSFHPPHIKQSIVYSQGLRFRRICNDDNQLRNELEHLGDRFVERGYNDNFVTNILDKISVMPREQLLTQNHPENSHHQGQSIPFITTYHPGVNRTLRKILRNLDPILHDDYLNNVFSIPPMIVNRQPRNLGSIIVSSKMSDSNTVDVGTFQCGDARCRTCQHICNDTHLSRNNYNFNVRGSFTCRSCGVVYLIRCNLCPLAWYVGETCNALRTRMCGHRQTIRDNTPVPVGLHFNLPHHSLDNLNILILKGGLLNNESRKRFETEMIVNFGTHLNGLNRDVNFMSHYKSILNKM